MPSAGHTLCKNKLFSPLSSAAAASFFLRHSVVRNVLYFVVTVTSSAGSGCVDIDGIVVGIGVSAVLIHVGCVSVCCGTSTDTETPPTL